MSTNNDVHCTMATRSGLTFDLLTPEPNMVRIEDVAWHLSRINRWTGAARREISVAEHALLVVEILERDFGTRDPMLLHAALHHDSDEAYTGDLSGPMKTMLRALGVSFNDCTAHIKRAVQQHFGVAAVDAWQIDLIKAADVLSRHTEFRDLVCPAGQQHQHPPGVDWIDLNDREGMDADDWRLAFLDKHAELAARCEVLSRPMPL